jgi:hypothetical protein
VDSLDNCLLKALPDVAIVVIADKYLFSPQAQTVHVHPWFASADK